MITYTQPKPRGIVTTGDLVFFSADTRHRVVICVLEDTDGSTVLARTRLEFTDTTTPSYAAFVAATSAGQFRNAIEAYLATIPATGGIVS
jgi:hypothetical protein